MTPFFRTSRRVCRVYIAYRGQEFNNLNLGPSGRIIRRSQVELCELGSVSSDNLLRKSTWYLQRP